MFCKCPAGQKSCGTGVCQDLHTSATDCGNPAVHGALRDRHITRSRVLDDANARGIGVALDEEIVRFVRKPGGLQASGEVVQHGADGLRADVVAGRIEHAAHLGVASTGLALPPRQLL